MARRKTPKELADLTGQTKRNPARHKDKPKSVGEPIGEPPSWMSDDEQIAFEILKNHWSWLAASDEPFLHGAARMYAKIMDPEFMPNAAFLTAWRMTCGQMGGTPTDIAKLSAGQLARANAAKGDDEPEPKLEAIDEEPEKPKGAARFFN